MGFLFSISQEKTINMILVLFWCKVFLIFLATCSVSVLICSSCYQGEKTKDSKSGADSNISVQNLSSQLDVAEEAQVQLSQVQLEYQGVKLINFSCFAELPTAGSNVNHRFRIKDSRRIWIADSNLSRRLVVQTH